LILKPFAAASFGTLWAPMDVTLSMNSTKRRSMSSTIEQIGFVLYGRGAIRPVLAPRFFPRLAFFLLLAFSRAEIELGSFCSS
jgi:hypothetical protein